MASPLGELYFAAQHCLHGEAEMRALGDQVMSRIDGAHLVSSVRELLAAAPVSH